MKKRNGSQTIAAVLLSLSFLIGVISLSSCNTEDNTDDNVQEKGTKEESTVPQTEPILPTLDTSDMDLDFSKGDLNSDYDGENATVINLADGSDVSITGEGTYILRGEAKTSVAVNAPDTAKIRIVLDGVSLESESGPAIYVKEADKVFLILAEGSVNEIIGGETEATDGDTALDGAIFSKADLTLNGSGSLTVNGKYKHGIVSKDDLVITGGEITVTSVGVALEGKDCVKIGDGTIALIAGSDGIRSDNTEDASRGFVYIKDGDVSITAGNDGVQAETLLKIDGGKVTAVTGGSSQNGPEHYEGMGGMGGMMHAENNMNTSDTESYKGLKSAADIIISGGKINIDSADDCIHANRNVSIIGGEFTMSSGDDGVHADSALSISGGTFDIQKSYEGLEGTDISISGGNISLVASDDGLNAAGGNDGSALGRPGAGGFAGSTGSISISGGYIFADASGDGIDSNGTISISGGVTLVSGPTNNGNGSFDYEMSASVSGGVLVALGSSGMAQGFSSAENQGAILTSITAQTGGTSFALCDESGRAIVSFTSRKAYQSVLVTAPAIKQGETYTVVVGGEVSGADAHGYALDAEISGGNAVATVEMQSNIYNSGGNMGGGPGGVHGGGPGGGRPQQPPMGGGARPPFA